MDNNNYCIYVLTNKVNGKKYVGQSKDYKKRMKLYEKCQCKNQTKLYNAILKYGWENFESRIIIDNLSLEDANELEIYFIKLGDYTNKGYNITIGGLGSKGRKVSEAVRKKMSEDIKGKSAFWNIGRKHSEETKKIMREKRASQAPTMKGKKHSEEAKLKMSLSKKGHPPHNKKFNSETEGIINEKYKNGISILDLSKEYNCSVDTINKLLKRNKTVIRLRKILTLEQEIELVNKHKEGVTVKDLMKKFNIGKHIVYNTLKKYNIVLIKSIKLTMEQNLEIFEKYNNNVSTKTLAEEYNRDRSTINSIIRKFKKAEVQYLSA